MRRRVNVFAQHPASLALRLIGDHTSPGIAGGGTFVWTISNLSRATADIELVHLHGAVKLMLAGHQQPPRMAHTPGGGLADTDRLGQAH
jgi:hypothetical protein